jgi:hypothetical protein
MKEKPVIEDGDIIQKKDGRFDIVQSEKEIEKANKLLAEDRLNGVYKKVW